LSYDETADVFAELGFDGIEAAVRPGGHVLPERVEEDLPKFAEALKKRGLEITILTSGISGRRRRTRKSFCARRRSWASSVIARTGGRMI